MLGRLGKRHIEQAAAFAASAAGFGGAAFFTLLYFTDWKVFVGHIPYYNGQFTQAEIDDPSGPLA